MPTATEAPTDLAGIMSAVATADLLRAAYRLTHQIHAAGDRYPLTVEDFRAQRGLIDAEIVRRAGA